MNLIELAWAAGFFDGEGSTATCIGRRSSAGRAFLKFRISIGQAEPTVLHRFRDAVGVGAVYGPYDRAKYSGGQVWVYTAQGDNAKAVLRKLWPYLSEPKKAQALKAITKHEERFAAPSHVL